MLKAFSNQGIILGLSAENIKRLTNYQPIKFNLTELNGPHDGPTLPDVDIFIIFGETEKEIANDLLKAHATRRVE
jgi:hypothetical protein